MPETAKPEEGEVGGCLVSHGGPAGDYAGYMPAITAEYLFHSKHGAVGSDIDPVEEARRLARPTSEAGAGFGDIWRAQ